MNGVGEAQVAFLGEPEQRAQTTLVTFARQAELVRRLAADQVFDVERGLARKRLVEKQEAASGVLVEVVDLQVHGWVAGQGGASGAAGSGGVTAGSP